MVLSWLMLIIAGTTAMSLWWWCEWVFTMDIITWIVQLPIWLIKSHYIQRAEEREKLLGNQNNDLEWFVEIAYRYEESKYIGRVI
jgi:hypothetical protein